MRRSILPTHSKQSTIHLWTYPTKSPESVTCLHSSCSLANANWRLSRLKTKAFTSTSSLLDAADRATASGDSPVRQRRCSDASIHQRSRCSSRVWMQRQRPSAYRSDAEPQLRWRIVPFGTSFDRKMMRQRSRGGRSEGQETIDSNSANQSVAVQPDNRAARE